MKASLEDGSPYISHPVEVASILLDLKVDLESVCAGFMHDVLEDCDVQKTTLEKMFGKDVVSIIDGVSKLNKICLLYTSPSPRDS